MLLSNYCLFSQDELSSELVGAIQALTLVAHVSVLVTDADSLLQVLDAGPKNATLVVLTEPLTANSDFFVRISAIELANSTWLAPMAIKSGSFVSDSPADRGKLLHSPLDPSALPAIPELRFDSKVFIIATDQGNVRETFSFRDPSHNHFNRRPPWSSSRSTV